jgi:hypothetical protein
MESVLGGSWTVLIATKPFSPASGAPIPAGKSLVTFDRVDGRHNRSIKEGIPSLEEFRVKNEVLTEPVRLKNIQGQVMPGRIK